MTNLVLTLNTALDPIGFSINSENDTLFQVLQKADANFTENIAIHIKNACESSSIFIKDLTALGVILGPGSYTGLRIGLSTIKSIAAVLNIPIFSRTTFQQLANQVTYNNLFFAVVLPGKRNFVTLQFFNGEIEKKACSDPVMLSHEQFLDLLDQFNESLYVFGQIDKELVKKMQPFSNINFFSLNINCAHFSSYVLHCIETKKQSEFKSIIPYYCYEPMIGTIKIKK